MHDTQSLLNRVVDRIDTLSSHLSDHFPSGYSHDLTYKLVGNTEWTPGFWTGLLWLAYEYTGNATYRDLAEAHLASFQQRLDRGGPDVQTHDLGFLYTLSCVAADKLTGNQAARHLALRAADQLRLRYFEQGRIIQSWGRLDDPAHRGRIIIDSTMNMSLLYWASETTGDATYRRIASNHLHQCARYLVRHDGSTFHTYYVDPDTGNGRFSKTHQGFSDTSCWARGQAWGIYGFALGYRYTQDPTFCQVAKQLANFFLTHTPSDDICYWDLIFAHPTDAEKDSSAAAIAAAGLLELGQHLSPEDEDRTRYHAAARQIIHTLSTHYLSQAPHDAGILRHGVCHRPAHCGVDEFCIWGDYFYTEALMRLYTTWTPYW